MSGKTVVIGCKIPNGVKIRGAGKEFTLNGSNTSNVIGGYGITENVPADVWEDYAKAHAKSPAIVNELIFAQKDTRSARDAANERKGQKTGLEQIKAEDAGVKEDKEAE